ncbi:glutathione S-transferase family protein [Rhodoblastus acidophilus]|uniref:Glutathione S-transferase family protein n=1 Tax=Candidatus Rhodoblastus alkanivorans TaxID=2954117 RepID=A0ABS9Z5G8_9HYPH|nr:glutathione S-transferase family protein [Candidatus Rhodoblastus alkanivorans]MCI4679249.1 glutathione S-transferase family protein [Candidatus Rhodoblastus alkanivorans]MCI4682427.1 glutathione S-transferase family protein [Candidatus Rhodoblastus alkanivorans]MDI4639733.1 glutathione S-transferase family protein [Rhodoblastus acidophilus]
MGMMVEGVWRDIWYDTAATGGAFQRPATQFHGRISAEGPFAPQAGRYHLYVSWACPWAHRTLITRKLKGLEDAISVSFVEPLMLEHGWTFAQGADPVNGARFLWEVYAKAEAAYTGRVTVPVLWDRERKTIVNNESAEIIRMFDAWPGARGPLLRPPELAAEIDALNDMIYPAINNGVYRAGFATSQAAYDEAFDALFAALDALELRLNGRAFLAGEHPTEADWRLFTTLIRFDAVYVGHFKCNRQRIADYPELWDFTRALYQAPGIAETVRLDQIKTHYYGSHRTINPTGIIPKGPAIDLLAPTRRRVDPVPV